MGSVADNKSLKRGTVLTGRYEIGDMIGQGGFGATYLAKDRHSFEHPCVVKQLLATKTDDEVALRGFEREALMLKELRHERIPELQAYFAQRGRYYLVQQFIEGETLRARLAKTTSGLGEAAVRDIVLQLLDVLTYLHDRKPPIVHRDIKPANIIIKPDGRVYLIDFGAVHEALTDKTVTQIGTRGYTPYEQASGHPEPASDLYALGATALHLATGREPLAWHDEKGQFRWRDQTHFSPEFTAFLAGTLVDVRSRFKTPADARAALIGNGASETLTEYGVTPAPKPATAAPPAPASSAPPPQRSRTFLYAGGAGLAAVGLVALALFLNGRPKSGASDAKGSEPSSANVQQVGAPTGEVCAERKMLQFNTESQFQLHILCPSTWTSFYASEQRATRIAAGDGTQVWASVWQPATTSETLAELTQRWTREMAPVLGVIQATPSKPESNGAAWYAVTGTRFPIPGSLQVESKAVGGNRFFVWSLLVGATPQSKAAAQNVLVSMEFVPPRPPATAVK